eukprot:Gb_14273 [translate_table: standard]
MGLPPPHRSSHDRGAKRPQARRERKPSAKNLDVASREPNSTARRNPATSLKRNAGQRPSDEDSNEAMASVRPTLAIWPVDEGCIAHTLAGVNYALFNLQLNANMSNVFKIMFESNLKESLYGEVLIQEVRGESLKAFLTLLYTAELSTSDIHANIRELVQIAHRHEVSVL